MECFHSYLNGKKSAGRSRSPCIVFLGGRLPVWLWLSISMVKPTFPSLLRRSYFEIQLFLDIAGSNHLVKIWREARRMRFFVLFSTFALASACRHYKGFKLCPYNFFLSGCNYCRCGEVCDVPTETCGRYSRGPIGIDNEFLKGSSKTVVDFVNFIIYGSRMGDCKWRGILSVSFIYFRSI